MRELSTVTLYIEINSMVAGDSTNTLLLLEDDDPSS